MRGVGKSRADKTGLFIYEGKTVEEWLPSVVERIVERFDPVRVILFGSRARGDAGPHSDVDLLVVMPDGIDDERRVTVEIRRLLRDMPAAKDIVVTTPEEIERRGDLVGTVLRPALREGKILYERA
ncbi:MAG: nucleotidyltransferase domain-containing protein [Rubrobacter sp.]|nr:nucleotidyltransferase domain-containing protein [Rubrobacter sp.]